MSVLHRLTAHNGNLISSDRQDLAEFLHLEDKREKEAVALDLLVSDTVKYSMEEGQKFYPFTLEFIQEAISQAEPSDLLEFASALRAFSKAEKDSKLASALALITAREVAKIVTDYVESLAIYDAKEHYK